MREHLVAKEFTSPQEMAKFADSLWEARNGSSGSVLAVGRRSNSPKRPQSPFRGKKKPRRNGLCFFPFKLGEKANRCEPPCTWAGNDQAAGDNKIPSA